MRLDLYGNTVLPHYLVNEDVAMLEKIFKDYCSFEVQVKRANGIKMNIKGNLVKDEFLVAEKKAEC